METSAKYQSQSKTPTGQINHIFLYLCGYKETDGMLISSTNYLRDNSTSAGEHNKPNTKRRTNAVTILTILHNGIGVNLLDLPAPNGLIAITLSKSLSQKTEAFFHFHELLE